MPHDVQQGSDIPSPDGKLSQTLRRQRIGLFRATAIVVTTSAAVIFVIVWYKAWPQALDCEMAARRLAVAMEDYREKHQAFPTVLQLLNVRTGRYRITHFEYRFAGFGAPANLPNGTLIAYCTGPHRALFHAPWRRVLVFNNGRVAIDWMPESEFQEMLKQQEPAIPLAF